jgi:hypothetical protein
LMDVLADRGKEISPQPERIIGEMGCSQGEHIPARAQTKGRAAMQNLSLTGRVRQTLPSLPARPV